MTETRDQIVARLKQEYPSPLYEERNGERYEISGQEYEDEISRMADNELEHQAAEALEEGRRQTRRQVKLALTSLESDISRLSDGQSMSVAQMRPIVLRMGRILQGIILSLIDRGVIEN